ncbi:MAG: site-specific integrase [Firmicutes bacterium]|nr:site-specific integrase [Bacillota bacterium]
MAKGHVRQLKSGNWELVFDLPREPGEERKQKSMTVKAANKKDAEKKLREILRQIDEDTYVDPGKMTLGDFLTRWLNDYCVPNRRKTTVDGYRVIINKHLIPALGHIKLAKLRPLHIQEYYTYALQYGRADGKGENKKLSPTTVHHHHSVLRKALGTAVKWQLLSRNVCDAVDPPRTKNYKAKVYDEDAVARLLEVAEGTRKYIPILITLATGLRRGEVLALHWSDFDPQAGTIVVDESLVNTSGGPEFDEVKTESSRAVIDLPESVVEELQAHRERQETEKNYAGEFWQENDLIICKEDGTRWHPGGFSDSFKRLLKTHKLPHIRFHDLRHTHASHLIRMGFHPKVVSDRLRHSKIGTTMDTYGHLFPGIQKEVARKLDETMFRKRPAESPKEE